MARTGSKVDVKVFDVNGDQINPATEETLEDVLGAVEGIKPATSVEDLIVTLVTPGTAVQFSDIPCKRAFVQALRANTGTVIVGGSNVDYSNGIGVLYGRTQGSKHEISNLNLLYLDGSDAGDKVSVQYEN